MRISKSALIRIQILSTKVHDSTHTRTSIVTITPFFFSHVTVSTSYFKNISTQQITPIKLISDGYNEKIKETINIVIIIEKVNADAKQTRQLNKRSQQRIALRTDTMNQQPEPIQQQ